MGRPCDEAQGGPQAHHGPGELRRGHLAPGHAVGLVRPLARGARAHRLHRRLRRGGARRHRARRHRRGRRRARRPAADGLDPARRRRQHARALAAGQGHRQARGRPGRRRHRHRPLRSRRRRRRGRGRVRPAPRGRRPRGGPQGRDDHPRGARHERLAPLVARRRGPRGGLRRGRPHHRAPRRQPPDRRRRHRAPRRPRRLPRRRAHDLDEHAGPALRAPVPRHPARHRPGPRPRGRAGRRRRLRLQAADVRRGGPALLGRPQAGAAGQVDRDPLGEHAGLPPRARSDRQGAHGRQERRLDHRVPRRHPGRLRRVPHAAHADDPVARGVRDAGVLQDARRPDGHHGRLHEQVLDGRHPRRGPPRGDPHDRDGARPGRRRAGHGPGRDPPEELHPGGRLPVRDHGRRRLRLRQLPGHAGPPPGAPRPADVPRGAGAAEKRSHPPHLPRRRLLDLHGDLRPRTLAGHRPDGLRPAGRRLGVGGRLRPHHRRR